MQNLYVQSPWNGVRIRQILLASAALTGLWIARPSGVDAAAQSGKLPQAKVSRIAAGPAIDLHTTALWLFDDPPYANVTLTDAGPYQIDLRLETGREKPLPKTMIDGTRGLVPGRFGRALHLPVGEGAGVSWPENSSLAYGTTYMSDRGDEVPERCNLGYMDFTMEFWFKQGIGPRRSGGRSRQSFTGIPPRGLRRNPSRLRAPCGKLEGKVRCGGAGREPRAT